jgi:hypothetical protein
MTTFKEIEEANRELANTPEVIEQAKIVKNKRARGKSADSAQVLESMLPSPEVEFKTAESLAVMFDTTKRAGAGGTKAGVVGIRPHGGKAASNFLEEFTGSGRMAPKKGAFDENVKIKDGKNLNCPQASVVIYKECMDCMKPVCRDACVPCVVPIPPDQAMNEITKAKWQAVNIRPGDVLCYLFCLKCAKDAHAEAQRLNRSGLDIVVMGTVVKAGQRYLKERGQRIEDHVFNYIKRERHNPQTDIFYGNCKERG